MFFARDITRDAFGKRSEFGEPARIGGWIGTTVFSNAVFSTAANITAAGRETQVSR